MSTETTAPCFPECGVWLARRLAALPAARPVQPGCYDVAVWRNSFDLPLLVDGVSAPSPFQAIEHVMRLHRMRVCARASAIPSGGSWFQMYRAFGIELVKQSKAEGEVSHV